MARKEIGGPFPVVPTPSREDLHYPSLIHYYAAKFPRGEGGPGRSFQVIQPPALPQGIRKAFSVVRTLP